MKEKYLAYWAGFFDADGTITIVRQKRKNKKIPFNYYLKIAICNTNSRIIKDAKKLFKGAICSHKHKNKPRWKKFYHWQIQSEKAMIFLEKLLPYLRLKKKRAEIAIKFYKTTHNIINDSPKKFNSQAKSHHSVRGYYSPKRKCWIRSYIRGNHIKGKFTLKKKQRKIPFENILFIRKKFWGKMRELNKRGVEIKTSLTS